MMDLVVHVKHALRSSFVLIKSDRSGVLGNAEAGKPAGMVRNAK
jgi:hypothetical protein